MTAGGFDGVERRGLMFVLSSPSGARGSRGGLGGALRCQIGVSSSGNIDGDLRSVSTESQIVRRSPRISACTSWVRPNLKTRLAVRPANASAPAIVSSSICIDADCLSCNESAAASATGVTAGFGAGVALVCGP